MISSITGPDLGVSFSYQHSQALKSPFTGAQQFGTVSLLTGVTNTIVNLTQTFTYGANQSAELVKATTPLGGEVEWDFANFTYTTQNLALREVSARRLRTAPGAAQWTYTLGYDSGDGARQHHWQRWVIDAGADSKRHWYFHTDAASPYFGMAEAQVEYVNSTWVAKWAANYLYTLTASGQPYINGVWTRKDAGSANEAAFFTGQEVDQYGNLTRSWITEHGAAWTALPTLREFRMTYLGDSAYVNGFVRNRVVDGAGAGGRGIRWRRARRGWWRATATRRGAW
jgi:hypothetical protein